MSINNSNTITFKIPHYEVEPKKVLKDSFLELWWKNISGIDIENDDVKREYLKYHYLILNKLYFDKNNLEYTSKILNNSTKKAITHSRKSILDLLSDERKQKVEKSLISFWKRAINEEILSYPLFYMWEYVNNNINDLKKWNEKQIDFAEHFWLTHLQDVKNIVEILWFNHLLNWTTINLSVNTLKGLKVELESIEESGVIWSINWNSLLLSFASSLKQENFENLYYWAVALWYKEKMWIQNVKMPTMRMLNILESAKDRFWKPNNDILWENVINLIITEEWIHNLFLDKLKLFTKMQLQELSARQISQIKSNIRSALRGFWYRLETDIYKLK